MAVALLHRIVSLSPPPLLLHQPPFTLVARPRRPTLLSVVESTFKARIQVSDFAITICNYVDGKGMVMTDLDLVLLVVVIMLW